MVKTLAWGYYEVQYRKCILSSCYLGMQGITKLSLAKLFFKNEESDYSITVNRFVAAFFDTWVCQWDETYSTFAS